MTNAVEFLANKGIRLNSYAPNITHATTCPECSHTRKKKTDPCLSVKITETGIISWNCHHCPSSGKHDPNFKPGKGTHHRGILPPRPAPKPVENYKDGSLSQKQREWLKSRHITDEVIARYKLSSTANGGLQYPYYQNGKLVNVKTRILPKEGFYLVKEAALVFYGLDDIQPTDEEVIIVEGEMDKLALAVCGKYNVLSVPNGAQKHQSQNPDSPDPVAAYDYLNSAEEIFSRVKRVILMVDNDAAGNILEAELSRRIGMGKCWRVRLPVKDANDMLIEYGVDVLLDCVNEAEAYPIEGIYSVSDVAESVLEYYHEGRMKGLSTGWPELDKFYTVREGQLSIVTGIPNSGKSELIDAMVINLAQKHGWRTVVFSPENRITDHISKLLEKSTGMAFSDSFGERMTETELKKGMEWLDKYFHFIVYDEDDMPTFDWVLARVRDAVYRFGVRGVVIDPYNEMKHKSAVTNRGDGKETDYINEMLGRLRRFIRTNGVHLWLVAHPKQLQTDKHGKLKIPNMYDISGSAHWFNKADMGLIVHRTKSNRADVTNVIVSKVRFKELGRKGTVSFKYDVKSGRYAAVPPRESDALAEEIYE